MLRRKKVTMPQLRICVKCNRALDDKDKQCPWCGVNVPTYPLNGEECDLPAWPVQPTVSSLEFLSRLAPNGIVHGGEKLSPVLDYPFVDVARLTVVTSTKRGTQQHL